MDETRKLLKDLQPKNRQPYSVPIATDMFIPNHSGTHDAGILLKVPAKDIDLVNKKYVDDKIAAIPTPDMSAYAKLDGSNQPFTGNLNISKSTPTLTLTDENNLTSSFARSGVLNTFNVKSYAVKRVEGSAVDYDGTKYTYLASFNPNGTGNNFSFSIWFYADVFAGTTYLLTNRSSGANSNMSLFTTTSGANATPTWDLYDTGGTGRRLTATGTVSAGAWNNIIGTYDGGTMRIYINGVAKGTTVLTFDIAKKNVPITLAGLNGANGFDGKIDQTIIWKDRVLDTNDVAAIYNGGTGVYIAPSDALGTNAFVIYDFDEGVGNTLIDLVAAKNLTHYNSPSYVAGVLPSNPPTAALNDVIQTKNGVNNAEEIDILWGDSAGKNTFQGVNYSWKFGGTEKWTADSSGNLTISGAITIGDANNIAVGTTTGTKIGTATTQKLGFYNATPIVQVANTTEIGTVLSNLGLRAAGVAYPITTSGSVNLLGSIINVGQAGGGITSSFYKYGAVSGDLSFIGNNASWQAQRASSNSECIAVRIANDAEPRLRITSSGDIRFGDGTNPYDVRIKRGSADVLAIDDALTVSGAITAGGAYLTNITSGSVVIGGTSGALTVNSNLTFMGGNTLNATNLTVASGAYLTNISSGSVVIASSGSLLVGVSGATGTFTTTDSKTVTVTNGIITSIV